MIDIKPDSEIFLIKTKTKFYELIKEEDKVTLKEITKKECEKL